MQLEAPWHGVPAPPAPAGHAGHGVPQGSAGQGVPANLTAQTGIVHNQDGFQWQDVRGQWHTYRYAP